MIMFKEKKKTQDFNIREMQYVNFILVTLVKKIGSSRKGEINNLEL